MTSIQENKLRLIKSRFKQIVLRLLKTTPIDLQSDLQSLIDPGRAFHSLGAAILKAQSPKPLSLLRGTANWLETAERDVQSLVFS